MNPSDTDDLLSRYFRLESLVGRDRMIRPLLPGPGAVIQALKTISGSAPVSN